MTQVGDKMVAWWNPDEVVVCIMVDDLGDTGWTHYCWVLSLAVSGPANLTANTAGTYTLTATDWQGNPQPDFAGTVAIQIIDNSNNANNMVMVVEMANGTGTFQFTPTAADSYTISGTGATFTNIPYNPLPQGGLAVTVTAAS